jgi:competence protein ComEC
MFLKALENAAPKAQPSSTRRTQFESSHLEVRMFNVGEGEAILLVFPDKRAWLIDGGSSNSTNLNQVLGQQIVAYLEGAGLTLETFVPSHPHVDHTGALTTILKSGSAALAPSLTIYRSDDGTWNLDKTWLNDLRAAIAAFGSVEVVPLKDAHREVVISEDVHAHLFAGSADGAYTSIFLQLRFHRAKLLFTGDAHCAYEKKLLQRFGAEDFRADVLKVTHHGSSSGTARTTVEAVKPAIAIASTGSDSGHRLEADTLLRLGGQPGPRAIYETILDGDIVLRTDGQAYGNGTLYDVSFETPGRFTQALGAGVVLPADIHRSVGHDAACA